MTKSYHHFKIMCKPRSFVLKNTKFSQFSSLFLTDCGHFVNTRIFSSHPYVRKNLKKQSVAIIVQICEMLKVYSQCSLLVFPVLLGRNIVLKRSQILSLRPQTCTTFSQHCSCSQELGKQVTHIWKKYRQLQQQITIFTCILHTHSRQLGQAQLFIMQFQKTYPTLEKFLYTYPCVFNQIY